jgi:hypothetical protein
MYDIVSDILLDINKILTKATHQNMEDSNSDGIIPYSGHDM